MQGKSLGGALRQGRRHNHLGFAVEQHLALPVQQLFSVLTHHFFTAFVRCRARSVSLCHRPKRHAVSRRLRQRV